MVKEIILIFVLLIAFVWYIWGGVIPSTPTLDITLIDKPMQRSTSLTNSPPPKVFTDYRPGSRVRFAPTANQRTYDKKTGEFIGSKTVYVT